MGKPVGQARGEVDFSASIYGFYADSAEALMADEPIELLRGEGSAVDSPQLARRPARDHAVELPVLPGRRFAGPNLIIGNTILLKHAPAVPAVGRGDAADLRGRWLSRRRRT